MRDPVYEYMNEVLSAEELASGKKYTPPLVRYPAPEPKFDPWDDALMHDIMGNDNLAKPVQKLLVLYSQLDATQNSFGVSPHRFLELCQPLLKELQDACEREFDKL